MPSLDKPGGAVTTTVKWRFPSTHPEGRKFAAASAALTLFAFLLGWDWLGWLLVGLTIWVFAFFRDPNRMTPRGDQVIIAPAHRFNELRVLSSIRAGWVSGKPEVVALEINPLIVTATGAWACDALLVTSRGGA